jgi:hypothetical protein
MLDSLADIKIIIMNRYEQWRANPFESSVQSQPRHSRAEPAFNLSPQASIFRRSVYSNETNTLSPFSTRSSPWLCTSVRSRNYRLPPHGQSPYEGDSVDMPEIVEEPSTLSSLGLMGVLSLESSESSTSTILAESPPPPFIPSPYIPSPYVPSPYVPPAASSTHSHPSSSSSPLPNPPQEPRDPGDLLPLQGPELPRSRRAHGQFAFATRAVW